MVPAQRYTMIVLEEEWWLTLSTKMIQMYLNCGMLCSCSITSEFIICTYQNFTLPFVKMQCSCLYDNILCVESPVKQ